MDQSKNPFEEERLQILQMVEEGKLSAVEAVGLLNALAKDARPTLRRRPLRKPGSAFSGCA